MEQEPLHVFATVQFYLAGSALESWRSLSRSAGAKVFHRATSNNAAHFELIGQSKAIGYFHSNCAAADMGKRLATR